MREEKILLVDDEEGLLELLRITLQKEHFSHIVCASSAAEALEKSRVTSFDLIVLDVGLPDFSGFDLCKELRRITLAPIIFLTARDSTLDKLSGLAIGGDDYITKPFEPLEVAARIQAMLRRRVYAREEEQHKETTIGIYDYGRFVLNANHATITVEGQPVDCTAKEYELLLYFCRHPQRVFTASQLYEAIWGQWSVGDDKAVSMQISRLRKKIRDEQTPLLIQNLRGIGYRFVPPPGRTGA
ncbi:DNA-binding response regulator [Paenibacillus oryzae]|uniref:DNA-binding response regulator n=1 Tax=Paenibacillus oryzae TaxID=1844972 RepID=A0A1A5YM78_9BACL|nr:response regulator transcription factor [Paenibacillus oryzae]OBR66734.1 DNA-binding response regulator [Paenibacillus oryzae]